MRKLLGILTVTGMVCFSLNMICLAQTHQDRAQSHVLELDFSQWQPIPETPTCRQPKKQVQIGIPVEGQFKVFQNVGSRACTTCEQGGCEKHVAIQSIAWEAPVNQHVNASDDSCCCETHEYVRVPTLQKIPYLSRLFKNVGYTAVCGCCDECPEAKTEVAIEEKKVCCSEHHADRPPVLTNIPHLNKSFRNVGTFQHNCNCCDECPDKQAKSEVKPEAKTKQVEIVVHASTAKSPEVACSSSQPNVVVYSGTIPNHPPFPTGPVGVPSFLDVRGTAASYGHAAHVVSKSCACDACDCESAASCANCECDDCECCGKKESHQPSVVFYSGHAQTKCPVMPPTAANVMTHFVPYPNAMPYPPAIHQSMPSSPSHRFQSSPGPIPPKKEMISIETAELMVENARLQASLEMMETLIELQTEKLEIQAELAAQTVKSEYQKELLTIYKQFQALEMAKHAAETQVAQLEAQLAENVAKKPTDKSAADGEAYVADLKRRLEKAMRENERLKSESQTTEIR